MSKEPKMIGHELQLNWLGKRTPDESLSSILILNTFAHTMGAAGVAPALQVFGPQWET